MANLRGSMARAGKSDVFALGFSDKMKSVAGAMAVLALATTGTVVVQSQTAPAAAAQEADPAANTDVAAQAEESVAQEGEAADSDDPVAGEAATDATANEEAPAPGAGAATPPAAGAEGANEGDTAAQAETKSQNVTFGVRINGVAIKSGGSANPTQDLPETLHDVVVTLTSQADGTVYNSNDNGETWRGASGHSVVQNFGLKKLPAGTYNVSISGLDDISNDGLQVKAGSQLTNGGTVEITGSTGNLFIELEKAAAPVTQKVTFGVEIDGSSVRSGGSSGYDKNLPESVKDVIVTLKGADGTEYKSNDNGETWRGTEDYPVVQNFGSQDIPAGTYTVSISGLDDISNDGLQVKDGSQLTDGGTVEITGNTANLFIQLETVPEVKTQRVTFGVKIDGKIVESDGDNSTANELKESLRDVVVTLIAEDGTEYKSNDNGATWRGAKGYPVVQNFGLKDIPAGTYKVSITGLDDIDQDDLKVKDGSQLTDGGTVEITGKTGNLFIELETVDPADDKTSVDDSNVTPVDPTDEDQGT
ncbi:hypothetical protein, partial [Corynebacterium urealyticum]|uniref:hypothetical protein n=1 Tax=Corynebacterium urealyticum TaxID=43771 RepID=UPI0016536CE0